MKKLVFTLVAAFSLVVFGAKEKLATIQLADTETLVKSVSKLGEFTGNQMLGIMASQAMTKLPWTEVFGPARPGTATALVVFMENEDPSAAILYAPTETKAEFKKSHPKAVEQNGILKLPKAVEAKDDDEDDDEEDDDSVNALLKDDLYIAYSQDGKWLAASEDDDIVRLALAEVKAAEKKMDGDLVKVLVPPQGIAILQKLMEKQMQESEDVNHKTVLEVFKQLSMFGMGIRVNDLGLDVRGVLKPAKDSNLAKLGTSAIPADAWATIDPKAVFFGLYAANCGKQDIPFSELKGIFEKHGIKLDFLSEKIIKPGYSSLIFDAPASVAYFKGMTNGYDLAKAKLLFEDLGALMEKKLPKGQLFPLTNDPFGGSLVLKDFTPIANAKDRFETTLPEVKAKPCHSVGFFSLYSIFKALSPVILENLDKEERVMFEPMLLTLPSEGKTGTAWAQWCEKGTVRFIVRVGADELKSVSAGFAAFSAMQMQKMQQRMNEATKVSITK